MMTQGQSLSTIVKTRQLVSPLSINMMIVASKRPNDIYYHFDLNAGSGWNDEFGVPGTPMVFHQLAEQYLKRYEAIFFELDQRRAAELANRFRGIPHIRVESIDNRHFLEWARKLPLRAVGSIITDPNGWLYRSPEGVGSPVDELIECSRMLPGLDLIANLNVTHYRQMRGGLKAHPESNYRPLYRLDQMAALFNKKHGLISNISRNGQNRFIRLVLRNIPTRDHKAVGWHLLNSPKAAEIYNYLEQTQEIEL